MSDTTSTPNYQEILDKYAADLQAATKTIPEEPEVPQIITPTPEPEPYIPPAPEPVIATPPPRLEPIVVTPIDSPPPEIKPRENNFFKYLFFISLLIFLGVLAAVVYSFISTQKPLSNSSATPTLQPSTAPVLMCKINDLEYVVGASFPATDGCNTCTCNSDTSISCTEKACDVTPTKSATTSSIPKDWKTYENKALKFSFSYPVKYGVFTYKTSNGETGKNFIGSASGINFGGISTDFSEGRAGIFFDFSGYTNVNGSITFKAVQKYDKSWAIDKKLISEIFTNQNNVEVVLVKGENETGEYEGPVAGTPGEGKIGALINLKNSEFPGIAFEMDSKLGIQSLKEILSTFKFL